MAYIQSHKDENWLLPLSIKDMIDKNHICFFVETLIESLDFSKFDIIYEGPGHPAYHPRILTKIIVQGMLYNERSSRKISRACRENFIFTYLSEKIKPDFRTICRFRKANAKFIEDTFKETVKLASSYGLVDLSLILVDGSKIKANASKRHSLSKGAFDALDKIVKKMVEEDIAQDELDEMLYGDKEENLTAMDRKDVKRIVQEYRKEKDKEKLRKKHAKVKQEFSSNPKLNKASLTDPECRMMQNKQGVYELAYNVQFSVDSKNQIIIANDVCQDGNDVNQLKPQINNVEANVGKLKEGTKIGADCDYSSGDNFRLLEEKKLDGYIPTRDIAQELNDKEKTYVEDNYEYDFAKDVIVFKGKRLKFSHFYIRKDSGKKILVYKSKDGLVRKGVPEFFRERLRMKEKMQSEEGKAVYILRKITVEPVIGDIKQNYRFREFLLRGVDYVKIELNLVSIAHNLKKIWSKIKASGGMGGVENGIRTILLRFYHVYYSL